jgi:hypothetical protein
MKTQNILNNSLKACKAKKSCTHSIFNDTSHFNKSEAKMHVLKKRPLKRSDHNSCSLSFIWYYLSSCQDCGVFRIPCQAR